MWGMKAPRISAANTAGCLGRRLSAISRACGSLRLPPRPALADQSGNPRLAEPVHAIDRPARRSPRLDEPGAVAGQSEPTDTTGTRSITHVVLSESPRTVRAAFRCQKRRQFVDWTHGA